MTLSPRFEQALLYACVLHAGQVRKATQVPYISHLLSVAGLALEYGADEEEAIAALLHDAVEDAGAFSVVLEMVPAEAAAQVTRELRIPTIGVGAGPDVDGDRTTGRDRADPHGGLRPQHLAPLDLPVVQRPQPVHQLGRTADPALRQVRAALLTTLDHDHIDAPRGAERGRERTTRPSAQYDDVAVQLVHRATAVGSVLKATAN